MTFYDWDARSSYKVLVNRDKLYAIWPEDRETPKGWKDIGQRGSRDLCLNYIEEVWTDMRPLTIRQRLDEAAVKVQRDAGN